MSTVWSKFFWSDWQGEFALRACSYAARGLWMDMLCIAAQHDPIGYVSVAGRGLQETDIARMTGGLESEVHALLSELEQNGVFSRDRNGSIYSRRMTKDAKASALAKKNGRQGGNPSLSKQSEIFTPDNQQDNQPDKPPLKPHKPRARSQKNSSLRSELSACALPDWVPTDAWEAFKKMRLRIKAPLTDDAERLSLVELEKLKKAGNDPRAVLEQATMKSWRGLFPVKPETKAPAIVNGEEVAHRLLFQKQPDETREHFLVRRFRETGLWLAPDGAPPDNADTCMPRPILREFGYTQKDDREREILADREQHARA